MRAHHLFLGLAISMAFASLAGAMDFAKIERTIHGQPEYKSKTPMYALLVFGSKARLRVWVVLDGEAVYIDRNADGDLTGNKERFGKADDCRDIEIADPRSKTQYVITGLTIYKEGTPPQPHLMVDLDIKGPVEYQQYSDAAMHERPNDAPISHFDGPLTIGPQTINWKVSPTLALATGDTPTNLYATVGTMSAEHGCWVVVRTHHGEKSAFPEGVFPVVDVEFPHATPGEGAISQRYELDKFC